MCLIAGKYGKIIIMVTMYSERWHALGAVSSLICQLMVLKSILLFSTTFELHFELKHSLLG